MTIKETIAEEVKYVKRDYDNSYNAHVFANFLRGMGTGGSIVAIGGLTLLRYMNPVLGAMAIAGSIVNHCYASEQMRREFYDIVRKG